MAEIMIYGEITPKGIEWGIYGHSERGGWSRRVGFGEKYNKHGLLCAIQYALGCYRHCRVLLCGVWHDMDALERLQYKLLGGEE